MNQFTHRPVLELCCVILSFLSMYFVSGQTRKGRRLAFSFTFLFHACWLAYNYVTGQFFIMCYCIFAILMACRGFINNLGTGEYTPLEWLVYKYLKWKFNVIIKDPVPKGLILANHPSLLDGPLFHFFVDETAKIVANERQFRRKIFGKFIDKYCIEIPIIFHSKYSRLGQKTMCEAAIAESCVWLVRNVNVLSFYYGALDGDPRIKRSGKLPNRIVKELPNTNVSFMKFEGLYGSEFSYRNGKKPYLFIGFLVSLFKKRRDVVIKFAAFNIY